MLVLEDSGRQIGANSLLCFPPIKRKTWLSLFVTMRLAIFRLISHIQRSFEVGIIFGRIPIPPKERLFYFTKSYLLNGIKRVAKLAGLEPIRVHDLRHPYVKPTTKKYENSNCKNISLCLQLLFIPSWK